MYKHRRVDTLQDDEQQVFSFIVANALLIDELSDVTKCIRDIEYTCKHKGLSKQTVKMCRKEIQRQLLCGNSRMIHLGECIAKLLVKEALLIGPGVTQNLMSYGQIV